MSMENRETDENPIFLSRLILILIADWSEVLRESQQPPSNKTHCLLLPFENGNDIPTPCPATIIAADLKIIMSDILPA